MPNFIMITAIGEHSHSEIVATLIVGTARYQERVLESLNNSPEIHGTILRKAFVCHQ